MGTTSFEEFYEQVLRLFRGKTILAADAVGRIERAYRTKDSIIALTDIVKILNVAIKNGDAELDFHLDQKDKKTSHLYIVFK
jgi:hypothetical protein